MKQAALRLLHILFLPGGVLLVAAVLFVHEAQPALVAAAARGFPYLVFGAAAVLAWRFNRSGLVFSVATLALAAMALRQFSGTEPGGARGDAVVGLVGFLLPINLGLFSLLPERGTWVRRGLMGLAVLGGEAALVTLLVSAAPAGTVQVLREGLVRFSADWTPVPPLAQFAFALALLFFAVLAVAGRRATDHGFLWASMAAFLAMDASTAAQSQVYLAAAGLILGAAVVESSFRLAYRDALTRLPSRRALEEALGKLGEEYVIAMVDVDHFKKFNDTHGHNAGDQVLRMVASRLERVGGGGRAFRYGGEEFTLLFPDKRLKETLPELEAVREAVAETRFLLRAPDRPKKKPRKLRASGVQKEARVTVSMGAAEPRGRHPSPADVMGAADKALYRAKEAGRNRVRT